MGTQININLFPKVHIWLGFDNWIRKINSYFLPVLNPNHNKSFKPIFGAYYRLGLVRYSLLVIFLSLCHCIVYMAFYLNIYMNISLTVNLFDCFSIWLSISMSIYLTEYLFDSCSIWLFISLVYLSKYPSVWMSICKIGYRYD